MSHLVGFVDWSLAELTGRKDELITDPPLSQLMIFAGTSEGGLIVNGQVAVLRVRGGIRIGDILEYFAKLNDLASMAHKGALFAVRHCYIESESHWESEDSVVVLAAVAKKIMKGKLMGETEKGTKAVR